MLARIFTVRTITRESLRYKENKGEAIPCGLLAERVPHSLEANQKEVAEFRQEGWSSRHQIYKLSRPMEAGIF
jgi:hypothetical protein